MSALQNTRDDYLARIKTAASFIAATAPGPIDCLLVLGSGLGGLADRVQSATVLDYETIPGFPQATVPGHAGKLHLGQWGSKRIAVMQGRFHYYEGHAMSEVTFPIRVMAALGVKTVILTNAAGGMGEGMAPGDLMQITDHISLFMESPLRGMNLDSFGERFIDQTEVYSKKLISLTQTVAKDLGQPLHQGVYSFCKGPQFETPAEIRLLRQLGASAAGMSTVPEAIVARHCSMDVLGLSCITNLAAGLSGQPLNHSEVLEVGLMASDRMIALLSEILNRL